MSERATTDRTALRKAIIAAMPSNLPLRGRYATAIMQEAVGLALDALETRALAAEQRAERLEAALAPFAETAAGLPSEVADVAVVARINRDAKHPGTITSLTAGQFRRARAALEARSQGGRDA